MLLLCSAVSEDFVAVAPGGPHSLLASDPIIQLLPGLEVSVPSTLSSLPAVDRQEP
jgi:hypothetical protein